MLTTEKELGDVMMKLEGKRPRRWSFVLERLSQQQESFQNPSKAYSRKILGARYSELRNLAEHMFSVYIEFVCTVAEDGKKTVKFI